MKRIFATLFLTAAVLGAGAAVANADPEPGGNNPAHVCAPGQQGNPDPGFKPSACSK